jgi:hypothetical protein
VPFCLFILLLLLRYCGGFFGGGLLDASDKVLTLSSLSACLDFYEIRFLLLKHAAVLFSVYLCSVQPKLCCAQPMPVLRSVYIHFLALVTRFPATIVYFIVAVTNLALQGW